MHTVHGVGNSAEGDAAEQWPKWKLWRSCTREPVGCAATFAATVGLHDCDAELPYVHGRALHGIPGLHLVGAQFSYAFNYKCRPVLPNTPGRFSLILQKALEGTEHPCSLASWLSSWARSVPTRPTPHCLEFFLFSLTYHVFALCPDIVY